MGRLGLPYWNASWPCPALFKSRKSEDHLEFTLLGSDVHSECVDPLPQIRTTAWMKGVVLPVHMNMLYSSFCTFNLACTGKHAECYPTYFTTLTFLPQNYFHSLHFFTSLQLLETLWALLSTEHHFTKRQLCDYRSSVVKECAYWFDLTRCALSTIEENVSSP